MRQLRFFRWSAALTLALTLAPPAATAQQDDTVTISGLFHMDYLYGELDLYYYDPELLGSLLAVYDNGHEHTWKLTLHGTTQSHFTSGTSYATQIHATSFDFEFFGPDGATLSGMVSDHTAGGGVLVYLQNTNFDYGDRVAIMQIVVGGNGGLLFSTGHYLGVDTLFPADANGYPVVGPEPFSTEPEYTELGISDSFSGTGGAIGSFAGPVTFQGSVGEPDPPQPVVLAVADASATEGRRGSSNVAVAVTLSRSSSTEVTVRFATANGTARARSDYSATSGTLAFRPGETRRTISVAITGDRRREPNETFFVQLSNAVGATIADEVATVTILNDD